MHNKIDSQKAVGYCRVSTNRQVGEHHSSLETQEAHINQYCQQNGLMLVSKYTDVMTGKRDDRKEYNRMLDFARKGEAGTILIQFLDRIGRNPREILRRYWELEELGVKIIATDEDITEELMLLLKAGMAGAESRRTSERVRSNMGRAVSKGVHAARPPYGFKPVKEIENDKVTTRWELDPEEAPVVKEMCRLSIEENLGFKRIADRLTEKGYKTREGRHFAAYTVQMIMANPAIMGTLVYGRKSKKGNPELDMVKIEDFFPAIITKDEWNELQERFTIRRGNPRGRVQSSPYLLSGILKCGHCGGPMTGKLGVVRKDKQYRNYYCSRAVRSRGQCSYYNGHSTVKLEKAILEYLGQFSDPELVKEYIAAVDEKELKTREKELRDVEKRLRDIDDIFMVRLNDLLKRNILSEEEFSKANKEARDEKIALESRKEELTEIVERDRNRASMVEELPQTITGFLEAFESLDIQQQKVQLQSILKTVHVYNDGKIEIEFRD